MTAQESKGKPVVGAALIVGGGVGGMQAALDLAESGVMVYLVESKPSIAGVMSQLDKTFPTNDCSMCMLAPRLVETGRHPNIKIITYAQVEKLEGEAGNFKAVVRKRARYVDEELCVGCGDCWNKCPVRKPIPSEYDEGLVTRRAVYRPFPQAIPNVAVIDKDNCIYFQTGKCGACKKLCKAKAIDFDQKDEIMDLDVGAVILAPGYEVFDANLEKELGYGRFPNVLTSLEFERVLSASGPFSGKVVRPSDKEHPKRVAFVQCVGSRDTERNYCSSVCCMYATKEAILAKEHEPGLECTIFYIDLRAFGKGFDAYYERAKKQGIRYVRCRPSSIKQVPASKNLKVRYFAEDNEIKVEEFDMVVLSVGLRPPRLTEEIRKVFRIETNEHGFCSTSFFTPVESSRRGIFVCGPFTEPKDIPETVTQASGAASKVLEIVSEARGTRIPAPKKYPPEKDVADKPARIGVFVCHCGTNIAGVVNVPDVEEYAKTLPDVVHSENFVYACSNDTMEVMKKRIEEHDLNRVVVASCSPRTHEPLFRKTMPEAGLNPYLFEQANIRDQCSWVHMNEKEMATRKAKDLVRIAVAKSRLLEPLKKKSIGVTKSAVVVGGGVSGMTAALTIANQGFEVHLVEREKELGGNLLNLSSLLSGENPREKLDSLVKDVKSQKNIHVYTESGVSNIEGFLGNFKSKIKVGGGAEKEISHGVVVVATGAREHTPTEYLYGKSEKVLTQLQLEEMLKDEEKIRSLGSVVMIQCVGSRDDERPYCSRLCCSQAVKNALRIKEISPETGVFVLYRDMRTYGFREAYYRKAREAGVVFLRYEDDEKPQVASQNGSASSPAKRGGLKVSLRDRILNMPVSINADMVVLSAATVPHPENNDLAQMLKVPLNQDKFFLEAHMKLRPVDFATDGVFLCGMAHLPKQVDESISQAVAVGARAATILGRDSIELEANLSQVIDENCDGCAYCVDPCPYKAITLLEYMRDGAIKKTVEVSESACKGCGVCQATCPKKGITVRGFKLEQLTAMVEAALQPAEVTAG